MDMAEMIEDSEEDMDEVIHDHQDNIDEDRQVS